MVSNANKLPPHWRDFFGINHCSDYEEFAVPLKDSITGNLNESTKINLNFNDNNVNDKEEVTSLVPKVSEGAPLQTVSEGASLQPSQEDLLMQKMTVILPKK